MHEVPVVASDDADRTEDQVDLLRKLIHVPETLGFTFRCQTLLLARRTLKSLSQ